MEGSVSMGMGSTSCSDKLLNSRKLVYIPQIQGFAKMSIQETLILKVIFSMCKNTKQLLSVALR